MNRLNNSKTYEEQSALYKPKKTKKLRKIVITFCVILFVTVIVLLSVIPPIVMNPMVRRVEFKEVWTAEDFGMSAEKIMLTTADGLNIATYKVDVANLKAIVIFISGMGDAPVAAFFGHARMLKENRFGSILLEMRARGESEGDVVGLGYKEYLDVKAVVDYLTDKYKDVPIIVYGWSMGGATAIISIGEIAEIDGLISMSAFSSWEDVFYDRMINMGVPRIFAIIQRPFVTAYTTFKYGLKAFYLSPKDAIKKIGERPALIMHSTGDSIVPFSSFERIMKNVPEHVESWIVEGNRHGILECFTYWFNPQEDEEYSERILTFLNKHFGK